MDVVAGCLISGDLYSPNRKLMQVHLAIILGHCLLASGDFAPYCTKYGLQPGGISITGEFVRNAELWATHGHADSKSVFGQDAPVISCARRWYLSPFREPVKMRTYVLFSHMMRGFQKLLR